MKLPVCVFDIESDMLCSSCQEQLDRGDLTEFDVEFSRWVLERAKEYPGLEDLNLSRAIKLQDRVILVVKKRSKDVLLAEQAFLDEVEESFGDVLIFESPTKLRRIVRNLIAPAVELGINSLHLPDGFRESIVMLRAEDRDRIPYSKDDLRAIVSAVMGEPVIFRYQDEGQEKAETSDDGIFEEKMKRFTWKRRAR